MQNQSKHNITFDTQLKTALTHRIDNLNTRARVKHISTRGAALDDSATHIALLVNGQTLAQGVHCFE